MTDTSNAENDNLLYITTQVNRRSMSEQIPSDDSYSTDSDTDYDNIYVSGELPAKHKKKLSTSTTKTKKQKSQYAPIEKHKKQRRTLYIICAMLWCFIIAILILYLLYHYNIISIPGMDNAPIIINTISPTESPTNIPTIFPSKYPTSLAPTQNPSSNPSHSPSVNPTVTPTYIPSNHPSLNPSIIPTYSPTKSPSIFPTNNPSNSPTRYPSQSPTQYPTETPSINPSVIPTRTPTTSPSINPSITPSNNPTETPSTNPTETPSINPTETPSINPTETPSINPTEIPSINPTEIPSINPTETPSINPTGTPSINPTETPSVNPTEIPSINPSVIPSKIPTKSPSINPTKSPSQSQNPSVIPTKTPSISPTIDTYNPTRNPTQSPITRILRGGNEISDQGIIMNFPANAFPDSILSITIGSANDRMQRIFADTTSVFKARDISDVNKNAIHFVVENDPLDIVSDIIYKTIIPIPSDLLIKCANNYGYEIFSMIYQKEFDKRIIFPIFVLFESFYDENTQTLTTFLYPEIFNNKTADIILSCTPGTNIPTRRRRRLLQNRNWETVCKASEIICPIENEECKTLNPFNSGEHYGVDYECISNNISLNIIAVANGIIERSEISISYGEIIVIRNEDGSATLYGHLRERKVFINDEIKQGDIIGIGKLNHFHFEYIPNGEIYETKKRINPNDCFPPPPVPPSIVTTNDGVSTLKPSQSPLIPPNTHSPTPSPTIHLAKGSITVRDSGALADDSFAVYIDDFKVCQTEIGALNVCAINFIRPGLHTLTLQVLIAPDKFGTFYVELSDGWKFIDGTTSKDAIKDLTNLTPPVGWKGWWDFIVPFPVNNALSGNVTP